MLLQWRHLTASEHALGLRMEQPRGDGSELPNNGTDLAEHNPGSYCEPTGRGWALEAPRAEAGGFI